MRDDVLKNATCQALNIDEFDSHKLDQLVSQIEIFNGNKLIFKMNNGEQKEVIWETPKRSDCWTEAMREKARLDGMKRKNKSNIGGNK